MLLFINEIHVGYIVYHWLSLVKFNYSALTITWATQKIGLSLDYEYSSPSFSLRDSTVSETQMRAKIHCVTPREKGGTRQGERKIRD